jgi:hypothetical protein
VQPDTFYDGGGGSGDGGGGGAGGLDCGDGLSDTPGGTTPALVRSSSNSIGSSIGMPAGAALAAAAPATASCAGAADVATPLLLLWTLLCRLRMQRMQP